MIKFLRKIRQNLISEGKTGKYLKYAIGEIILVVIGILIALQINNWNENRKSTNVELKLLIDLKANLESTLEKFGQDTIFNSFTIDQFQNIKRYISEDLPYDKELDEAFGSIQHWSSPYPILTAYKTLQTKGLDIIVNEQLRNQIIDLYEYEYLRLSIDYDKAEWDMAQSVTNPFYAKHVRRFTEDSKRLAKPNNFESLKQNEEFQNILEMIISYRQTGLIRYKSVMESITKLITSIDREIKSRTLK